MNPMNRHVLVAVLALLAAFGLTACPEKVSEKPSEKPPEKPAAEAAVALNTRPTAGDNVAQARFAWYLFIQAMTPSTGPGGPLSFESWTEQCQLGTIRMHFRCQLGCDAENPQVSRKSSLSRQHGRQHGRRRYPEQ